MWTKLIWRCCCNNTTAGREIIPEMYASIVAAAYMGAMVGGLATMPISSFYKEIVDEVLPVEVRPLSEWTHVPALEHIFGLPVGAVMTKVVLNNMRTPATRNGTTAAFALYAYVYANTTAVKDRTMERRRGGGQFTTYYLTRDILLGRWDVKYQKGHFRTVYEFPCINI